MPWSSDQQQQQQQQQQLPNNTKKPVQCHPVRGQPQDPRCPSYIGAGHNPGDFGGACVPTPGSSVQHQRHQQLSEEVYRKLRQVDQQSSTLTGRGLGSGFSARILDRREYKVQGNDITVVQLVEIIKKPGQSLGLYLREGNGIDRFTGVFASRYGDNSELERLGDVIRPGDEILNVNNVEVSAMSIDDVVLMLSIPRRLLLRLKYMKNRRDVYGKGDFSVEHRPVVVFQKSLSEEHRTHPSRHHRDHMNSQKHQLTDVNGIVNEVHMSRGVNGAAGGGVLLKPASTASTWLGKRARQIQQQNDVYWQHQPQQQQSHSQPFVMSTQPYSGQLTAPWPAIDARRVTKHSDNLYATNIPATAPNLLRYPLSDQLGARRRHPAYAIGGGPSVVLNSMTDSLTPTMTVRRPLTTVGVSPNNLFDYGCGFDSNLQLAPFGPARQIWPQASYGRLPADPIGPAMAYKSNSLPRRRFQSSLSTGTMQAGRSVKWRNDISNVIDGSEGPSKYGEARSDCMSDIAGASPRDYHQMNGTAGRTIADIFSAEEYRNWAGSGDETMSEIGQPTSVPYGHRSRWYDNNARTASYRSSSLPSKAILRNTLIGKALPPGGIPTSNMNYNFGPGQGIVNPIMNQSSLDHNDAVAKNFAGLLDRLHISPVMNRRVPLRTLGSGFDVDRLSVNTLNGILSVSIVEGNNLKVPDKMHSRQLYVVIEVNEVHRARTGISVPEQLFRWNESFEIDVHNATEAQFFVYAWHPQLRHLFCHKGSMRLLDAFFVDQLSGNQIFTLNLEPSGQLLIRVSFTDMAQAYSRRSQLALASTVAGVQTVFGCPLDQLIQREKSETPIVLTRLIREIEDRGVDSAGLYYLCAAVERKTVLRHELERDARNADIGIAPAPDINLLACLVKDYLRELPQPLVPPNIYIMLANASKLVDGPSDDKSAAAIGPTDDKSGGNQQLVLRIIDCLPIFNKKTLILVMDHLRAVLTAEPHNGLTVHRLGVVFGPLLFCTSEPSADTTGEAQLTSYGSYKSATTQLNFLAISQATGALKLLLEFWPRRVNSSESNSSNATPS